MRGETLGSTFPEAARRFRADWKWVLVLGLLVQLGWALRLEHPTYMDAYYYATSGHELAAGNGFTTQIVWQYLDGQRSLPAPSHTYWMPLPSILAAAGYAVTDSFRAAQAPFWLLAGLLPWLSFVMSTAFFGQRWQAWTAALLTAWGGYYAVYFGQPSTFAPYAWAGGLGLLLIGLASRRRDWRLWLGAGLLAGVGHLTRADGLLLLMVAFVIGWQVGGEKRAHNLAALLAGYFLVMGPWFVRNLLVIGSPLPTTGAQTMLLTTYDELFAYGRTFDLAGYLNWGWSNILVSKLRAFWLALQTFVAVPGLIFLGPFVLWAWEANRRRAVWAFLRPVAWYAVLLVAVMVFLFTFPGGRGSVLHSSVALWPWAMVLAAAGIGEAVNWMAARRAAWHPERAKRVFAGMFVVLGLAVSLVVSASHDVGREAGTILSRLAEQMPEGVVAIVPDAPMFFYHTGRPAINVPNEPPDVVLDAARQFGAGFLILDRGHPLPLAELYAGAAPESRIRLVDDVDGIRLYALTVEP
jgi:hypothetical protein